MITQNWTWISTSGYLECIPKKKAETPTIDQRITAWGTRGSKGWVKGVKNMTVHSHM